MDTIDVSPEDARLPADLDAQPVVRAAAALQPMLRDCHDELEREQRLPRALVDKMCAAGFYRMVIPRALGGLGVDPLTYLRVVEILAEACGSVGWNIANNSIGQLVTLGLPEEGVEELYGDRGDTIIAGTAVPGGGQAVKVDGGYRVTGRWQFGSGCHEASWMLGSFQIMEDGQPRRSPEGRPLFWRGIFSRAEAEIVPGSWDVAGLRGTGSFDWTVSDVFLPERRTMVHAGIPLDNQWSRWPGVTYQLPAVCWVGPHHSAVITGIARAGINALIELAGGKQPRGRPAGLLCESPQVQDAVGRADAILNAGRAYRTAMITELWNTVAAGRDTTLEQGAGAVSPRPLPATARATRWISCTGTAAARRSSATAASPNAGATCTRSGRPSRSRPNGIRSAAGSISVSIPARACASGRNAAISNGRHLQ